MIFNISDQLNQALPAKGRLMALDVGTKRIGIALSDESRFLATPKLIINRLSNQQDFEKIAKFITENQVVAVIVGRPLNMDGSAIPMTEFCERFAQNLDIFLKDKFPIFLFEERLTSFEAREINASGGISRKKDKFIDDIAASIILQHFLDLVSGL
ncbi:MAG: Holliday junction resolvase RuvX [Pseudomonadota bacterium]